MKRLLVASLLLGGSLFAAMNNMPTFRDYDSNGDGKITKAEFQHEQQMRMQQKAQEGKMMRNAANAPSFSDIDANHDGYINIYEFRNHRKEMMQNKMQNKSMNQMGPGMNKCSGMGQGQGMGQGKNR